MRAEASERRTHGDVVTLSDVGAQDAGDHAAEVQQRHGAAPAIVRGSLALHAREAEEGAATWRREKARPVGDQQIPPSFIGHPTSSINCLRNSD